MGDVIGWGGFGVAVVSAAAAAVSALFAGQANRRSAANEAALVDERTQRERMAEAMERLAAAAETPPDLRPAVAWSVNNPSKNVYVLRNVGRETATDVNVDKDRLDAARVDVFGPSELPPMASQRLVLTPAMGKPATPSELWVSWRGQADPVAVPAPQWF